MIVLLGESGAGKDRIKRELVKMHDYHSIVTTTTRPPRPGEVDGRDYHFVDDTTFRACVDDEVFAEYDIFHTEHGDWYYGSSVVDYENSTNKDIIILTPKGYRDVLSNTNAHLISIYIKADYDVRRKRLEKRGDSQERIVNRMRTDRVDFANIENAVDYVVWNNGDRPIENVVEEILEKIGGN